MVQDHQEMTDEEILSLLATTKEQLSDGHATSVLKQEFLASCWQLCGVGCEPGDQTCVDQQCGNLCSLQVPQARQLTMQELLSQQQRQKSKAAQSGHNPIAGSLPEDFEEEQRVLQQRRLPSMHSESNHFNQFEEEVKDSFSSHPVASHHSNDLLGEMFFDQQA